MTSVWFPGGTQQAIAVSKKNKCLLVVLVHGDDNLSAEMDAIWSQDEVIGRIKEQHAVCLRLKYDSVPGRQFGSIYPVEVVPAVYFIGLNGRPVEILSGDFALETLVAKMDSAFQIHKEKLSAIGAVASTPGNCSGTSSPTGSGAVSPEAGEPGGVGHDGGVPAVPLQSRLARAQELLDQKRVEAELAAIEEEKEKERQRREAGKRLLELKQSAEEREMKELTDSRKKQKQLDREALKRVRDQIAADRQAKNAKFNNEKAEEVAVKEQVKAKLAEKSAKEAEAEAAERNKFARLQFRSPGRPHFVNTFESHQTLQDVYDFVTESSSLVEFTLLQMYPRREFSVDNLTSTLFDLDLVPSAILMILTPESRQGVSGSAGAVTAANNSLFSYSGILGLLSAPFTFLYNMVTSLFSTSGPGGMTSAGQSSGATVAKTREQEKTRSAGPSGGRVTMQGNQARLRNTQDDADDGATWNGNSTQQL